jgi:hypothetical protein
VLRFLLALLTVSCPQAWRRSVAVLGLSLLLAAAATEAAEAPETAGAPTPELWSLRPPLRPAVPAKETLRYGDRVANPIDAFVLRKLEDRGLPPAPVADRQTLVRRAYFDLLGLPPTPEQVEAFVENASPDAWSKLIDELLDSKQYGERWGRHWLDVARYADSGGYETDIYWRNAWRYRDYVVKSFNDDKPYDVFVQEQIAGDELWPDNFDLDPKNVYVVSEEKLRHLEALTGTGFYTLGPRIHESGLDARRLRYETVTDWVDATGSAFLGLTIGCARCHDHKFDPISQEDYFAMQAIFSSSKEVEVPLLTAMEVADWRQFYPHLRSIEEQRLAYTLFEKKTKDRPLTDAEKEKMRQMRENIGRGVLALPPVGGKIPGASIGKKGIMQIPSVSVLGHERRELIRPVELLERGELAHPRQTVAPAVPAVLAQATGRAKEVATPYGSRTALARWLTQPQHPLTARVFVNRVWGWHFGTGIVATPNDFGAMGQAPTHPDLLDWLATEFVARGWKVKEMHRLILETSTYRMSSRFATDDHLARDPKNRFLWRHSRRRLEAEALWDSVHATAGTLNLKMGGPPVVPPLAGDEMAALRNHWQWTISADPTEHTRRGVYILARRNFRFPMFELFDAPISSVSCPERAVTTVAPQALWSLNNQSVFRQAENMAARIVEEAGSDPQTQVQRAWRIALSRWPTAEEKVEALGFFETMAGGAPPATVANSALEPVTVGRAVIQTVGAESSVTQTSATTVPLSAEEKRAALVKLCLALYNLNEFVFVD